MFLMPETHVEEQDVQHRRLKYEVSPRYSGQHRNRQNNGTHIEGQRIGILHQRTAPPTEIVTETLRHRLGKPPANLGDEALESRRHLFLRTGITDVEEQKQLLQAISLPAESTIGLALSLIHI